MKKFIFCCILLTSFTCVSFAQNCNGWLENLFFPAYVKVGQVNITGQNITVEASFNRTTAYSGGLLYAGDLVSKHNTTLDVNYLLRPNTAEITTTNGYFRTPDVCEIELGKTYHAAMVYDGSTLKFYRDGFLMSQVNATGNLIQNNWQTTIGWYEPQGVNTNFIGYINEVRIWDVAKTQAEIKANMTTGLPNPTMQPGLVAYYVFDNLLNKQGNAQFNGSKFGNANEGQTNPACTLIKDSCNVILGSDTAVIINTYTPVIALAQCGNKIVVEDASTFNAGDTVMVMQMKGADIDSNNTSAFGTVTAYKNAGNYEMNIVKAKAGNTVELKNNFLRQYEVPLGRVQLIRVPYFQNYTVTDTLTCLPWDGRKGGVLVLNVANSTTMNKDINVSGRGFRGGRGKNPFSLTLTCGNNGFSYPSSSIEAADKGESIHELSNAIAYGKAPNANGGGGGVGHNSGGGGGSNSGIGGFGGYQLESCGNAPFDNRGWGGNALQYNNADNKIFLGGGGGSGHTDNTGGIDMNGGNGGGIAIILTNTLTNNGFKIISNGANAQGCDNAVDNCHDGSGGGGAAGTVLIKANSYTNNLNVETKGGKGGDLVIFNIPLGAGRIGPGGGGGGGITWFSQSSTPANVVSNAAAGLNGVILQDGNNPWGATAGTNGQSLFNLLVPVATVPTKPNIDSVRIKTIVTSCNTFSFQGFGYANTSVIQSWQWNFGDNTGAATQNAAHTYTNAGTYTVKLIVTDINGCRDSITTAVSTSISSSDFSYSQNSCNPLSIQFFNVGNTPVNPSWIFGDGGTNTGSTNPVHLYADTGTYVVKYILQNGTCNDTVTKIIPVTIIRDDIILTKDTTICIGTTKQLFTKPSLGFCWSPTTSLDNPLSPAPTTSTTVPITYYFTAEIPGTNIITNGDFSAGNTGFASGYNFANPNTTEGEYFIGTNPQSWNGGLSPCGDHTTGSGNMLLVNGSPVPDVKVWEQTVTVTPNTNYAFATWIQALFPPNPAQLAFAINGDAVGNLITASLPTCTWTRFYSTWNSGNNTTALISIINKNTLVQGNDFALDDISFTPVIIKRDSVKISIDSPFVKAGSDTLVCEQNPAQLTATGAASYSWLPSAGLSNPGISNPIATVTDTTQYIVKGISAFGCSAADTIIIFTKASPIITTIGDTGICKGSSIQLSAAGGNTYNWLPVAGLNNAGINNPLAKPDTTTTYIVSGTGSNGCAGFDTVKVSINLLPVVETIADTAVCLGNTIQFTAVGATTYSWLPVTGLSNAGISNPIATATDTTKYIVKGLNAFGCNGFDTVNVFTRLLPAVIAGNDTIVCASTTVQLIANGANTYSWLPTTGLNNAGIRNPIATPGDTTKYTVKGTDVFGCSNKDSVVVFTKPLPAVTATNDTTICKNIALQLSATGGINYQWLPAGGLDNAGIANPTATVSSTTTYKVIVTGANSCNATDSVKVTVKADPVFRVSPNDSACVNKPVQLNASGGNEYTWSPANAVSDPNIANPTTTAISNTTYSVLIKENICNISQTLSTTVKVFALPLVTAAKSNDITCATLTTQLTAGGADHYSWLPGDKLNNAAAPNPVAGPAATTLYTVTGTDLSTHCTASDTITVFVDKGNAISIYIPSAFSPNSDAYNPCFKAVCFGTVTRYSLSVYNRFGELVFYTEDPAACWDGTYKGKGQYPGNYVYMLKVRGLCREEFKKGNLILIR